MHLVIAPLAALAITTHTALAQIPVRSSAGQQFFAAYEDNDTVFNFDQRIQGPNNRGEPFQTSWQQSFDETALADGNAFGASAFQRVVIDLDLASGRTTLLQGSAALAGTILNTNPISARAESGAGLIFTLTETTQIRLLYDLEGRGNLDQQIPGYAALAYFNLSNNDAAPGDFLLRRDVSLNQIDTGLIDLALAPGEYTLDAGAGAFLLQDPSFEGGPYTLPAAPELAGGYSVSMVILPTPSASLPLVGTLLLAARRRRTG